MIGSSAVVLVGGTLFMVRFYPELTSLGPWIATTAHSVVLGTAMALRWRKGRWASSRLA
jgi:Na+-driven multidrug efflux pump